jgi:hypothetical protein
MRTMLHRLSIAAPLAGMLVIATPSVEAQKKVDFFAETHFRCYVVSQQKPQPATAITLADQFRENVPLEIDEPLLFCPPVSKEGLSIEEPEEHLTVYAAATNLSPHLIVETQDQFGTRTLELVGARVLLVPTQKLTVDGVPISLDFPDDLNHSWCYEANGEPVDQVVRLDDQFRTGDTVRVEQPVYFCNPVEKTRATGGRRDEVTRIEEEEVHLTCYDIHAPQSTKARKVGVTNQLEKDVFTITAFELLCVPAAKLGFKPES